MKQRRYVERSWAVLAQATSPPATMWYAGGSDRAAWYGFKFVKGMVIEGALRDYEGRAQGTMLIEILEPISIDTHGHWVTASYLEASDPHMRWWMSSGEGAKIAQKGHYHFCEGPAIDCKVTKRGLTIHLEKFRPIGQKEVGNQVPAWAFKSPSKATFLRYLKSKTFEEEVKTLPGALPWKEDDESPERESTEDESEKGDLKKLLAQARDQVALLEKRLTEEKKKPKKDDPGHGKDKKDGKNKGVKKKKKKKQKDDSSSEPPPKKKDTGKEKKRKRSPSPVEVVKKAAKKKKDAKKRSEASSSSSSEEADELFGETVPGPSKKKSSGSTDRGPFGGGEAVHYKDASSSDEEQVFQEAPAVQKVSSQVRLVQYAKKNPGRLSSRMLLKMAEESARGIVGAMVTGQNEKTPPIAVHYLITMLIPQLGNRLNMRGQRELRTLCTAIDMLARKQPAQAADLLSQRVKAIEKATQDAHWGSAQYLELLPPEAGGLLDRAEEAFLNKEYLMELKLKGMDKNQRGGWKQDTKPQEKGGKKGKEKGKGKGAGGEKDNKEK